MLQAFLVSLLLALAGCAGGVPEPEAALEPLPQAQTYKFLTVWECCLEACEREGFVVDRSKRSGDSGEFETELKTTFRDEVKQTDRARRLRGRVEPAGAPGSYTVRLAASTFVRPRGEEWSYDGPDPDLRARFERRLHESLTRRYQGPN